MAILTSRLNLTIPDPLESMKQGHTVLSDAYDIIDRNCHCRIVPNLESITDPFNGMHVYSEADNKNYIRKNGSFQQITGQGSNQGSGTTGFKVGVNYNTPTDISDNMNLLYATPPFMMSNGSRYLFVLTGNAEPTSVLDNTEIIFYIYLGNTSSWSTSDMIARGFSYQSDYRAFPVNCFGEFKYNSGGGMKIASVYAAVSLNEEDVSYKISPDNTSVNLMVYDITEVS